MKYTPLCLAAIFSILLFFSCSDNAGNGGQESDVALDKNQTRSTKAVIKSRKSFARTGNAGPEIIQSLEIFNENGQRIEYTSYDPSANGTILRSVKYQYSPQGQIIKGEDGTTTETYEYNPQGKVALRILSGGPGGGVRQENTYDPSGRLTESKYINPDGNWINSRIYQYKTNNSDSLIEEKRFEKTPDGKLKFQSHVTLEYNVLNQISKKTFYNENGTIYNYETYSYDNRGNLVEVQEFDPQSHKVISSTQNKYNEFGELISNENIGTDGQINFKTKYQFDESGNQTVMEYRSPSGEAWGERVEIEYFK